MRAKAMQLFAGTSGYSYKEWKGKFYPDKLAANQMLHFYAGSMPAVEINNTFYRMPKKEMLETWRYQVPDNFRFSIKASQRISHKKRLKDAEEEVGFLFNLLKVLGECLGVVLFQMPPYVRKDKDTLGQFLSLLPETTPCAFEFRHESWFDQDIFDTLSAYNKTLCIADETNAKFDQVVRTADVGYVRLRRVQYSESDLTHWGTSLLTQNWSQCFVFFKHEDECGGPELAKTFTDVTERLQTGLNTS